MPSIRYSSRGTDQTPPTRRLSAENDRDPRRQGSPLAGPDRRPRRVRCWRGEDGARHSDFATAESARAIRSCRNRNRGRPVTSHPTMRPSLWCRPRTNDGVACTPRFATAEDRPEVASPRKSSAKQSCVSRSKFFKTLEGDCSCSLRISSLCTVAVVFIPPAHRCNAVTL